MPTYDYQCEKCDHEFSREQRITEDPIKTCPECKGRKVKKLLSAPNFILKGGGWYADGYGSTSKSSGSGSEGGGDSDGGGSGGGSKSKSDSKSSSKSSDSGSSSGSGDSGGSTKAKKSAA